MHIRTYTHTDGRATHKRVDCVAVADAGLCVCAGLMNKQHDMLTNFLICTVAIIARLLLRSLR